MSVFKFLIPFLFLPLPLLGQSSKIITLDIDNFWIAYDSIEHITSKPEKIKIIQELYVDKGTLGLHSFMSARNYSAENFVELLEKYPKFWKSVRPNTLIVKKYSTEIEESLKRFKLLYPELKDATMYFTIGGLRSGGTVDDDMVLIGTEIAAADSLTDVSEFQSKWLPNVFRKQSIQNLVYLNIHEYVHTQQSGGESTLLGNSLKEGACDFIAELILDKPISRDYIEYGKSHETELKLRFKKEMFLSDISDWLGNGTNAKDVADLGYFMGYTICKAYYNLAINKEKAIKDIIQLDYSDEDDVDSFLANSNYYPEGFDKDSIVKVYEKNQPEIGSIEPIGKNNKQVNPELTELNITFSKPMSSGVSINFGVKGKEFFPITGIKEWSSDKKTLILNLKLEPNHEYEFEITTKSFRSIDGYKLKGNETITFKTK